MDGLKGDIHVCNGKQNVIVCISYTPTLYLVY